MAFTKKWGYNSTDDYNGSSEDVYMYKDNPDTTHDDDNIWLGTFANVNRITRALIRFAIKDDLTSLGDISIISAKLYLYTNTLNGTHNVSAFRVVQDWNEAELTWNSFKSGGSWNSPGVESASDSAVDDDVTYDRFLTAEDIKSSGSVGGYNCILDLTSLTQKWFSGDNKEYGVFLLSDNESINNNVQFIDHEGSDGQRPYLEIEYEIVFNPGEWSNKLKLTVDGSKIDGDMADFPVLISLSSNSGQGYLDTACVFDELATASGSYDNRKKIAVTTTVSGVETELYVEIERWDDTTASGNEQAWLWTKVPTIVSGTNTELYLYYDSNHTTNSGYIGDTGETPAQNVWSNGFVGVWHGSQVPTGVADDILDSTSKGHHGTSQAALTSGDWVDGKVGKAYRFASGGTTDRINIEDSTDFAFSTDEFTIEYVVKPTAGGGTVFANYETVNLLHSSFFDNSTSARVIVAGTNRITGMVFTADVFQHYALVREVDDVKAYVNNVQQGSTWDATGVSVGQDTKNYIGATDSAAHTFDGDVDEVRISTIGRSSAWLKATYYSNWDDLMTFESEWLYGWTNRIGFTIDKDKVDSDLANFPVMINISMSAGQTNEDISMIFDELGSDANRKKIAVTTASDGAELFVEIEKWDDAAEQANLWIKVPTIVSGTDTELYLYYDKTHSDNTEHVGDVGDTVSQNVWDSNFNAVFHFSEDSYTGAASEIRNSVGGTDGHAINAAQPFSALIGNGLDVDDADKGALTESNINPGNVYTAESFFYKPWSTAGVNALFRSISPNQYYILIDTDNLLAVYDGSWRKSTYNLSTISNGWHHLSAVSDDTNTYFYVDGDYVDSVAYHCTGGFDHFGGTPTQSWGDIDEVRVSDVQRSAAWIKATYYTGMDDLISFSVIFDPVAWANRLILTIDSNKVNEDLIDFPVLVSLSSSSGQTGRDTTSVFDELTTASGSYVNRKKIAVTTASGGAELFVEIERWDDVNEKAILWTKVPTIVSGTDTVLYLYYDSSQQINSGHVGDTGDTVAQNVWDGDFAGVWHMAQDPSGGSGCILDSTSSGNNFTPEGSMLTGSLIDGKIGKCLDFDGNNDDLIAGSAFVMSDTPTVEVIHNGTEGLYITILEQRSDSGSGGRFLSLRSTSFGIYNSGIAYSTGGNMTYVAGTKDGNNYVLYLNGFYDNDSIITSDSTLATHNPLTIAARTKDTDARSDWANADIDEVRISNIHRSAAWIKATYYSNWDNLVSFGVTDVLVFTFINPIPTHLSTVYGIAHTLQLTTTISGNEPSYAYDAVFYDAYDDSQIGSTVSGLNSGQSASTTMQTLSGIDYNWYLVATSSGQGDTSSTYNFTNRFLCSGTTEVNSVLTSDIPVRLYRRSDGVLIGSTTSTSGGLFEIESTYNESHYAIAMHPTDSGTNALIYDWLTP